jgi:transcriptional regulator with XRE-family HTH domain
MSNGAITGVTDMDLQVPGERIKALRIARDWSRNKLAALAEISQGNLSDIENGKVRSPSGTIIGKLADTLGTSTDYLLGRTDDPSPPSAYNESGVIRRDYPLPPVGYEDLSPEEREHVDRITAEFERQTIELLLRQKREQEKRQGR